MLVVKRAFRNYNAMLSPGSVVEPGDIKRYKSRAADGYLIEVDEHNFDAWREYFKIKYGVDIADKPKLEKAIEEPKVEEPVEEEEKPKAKTAVKAVKASSK